MNIVVDMNLSPRWCDYLSAGGHQAQHWSDIGEYAAADVVIMQWARDHDCIVLTHDLDFGTILATTGEATPSVIQLRVMDVMPESVGPVVLHILDSFKDHLDQGALIAVDPQKMRVRILPLTRHSR